MTRGSNERGGGATMAEIKEAAPWMLPCPWCSFRLLVGGRGSHEADQGSGFEAAIVMQSHVEGAHPEHSWQEACASWATGTETTEP